ncbi:MAG: glutathione peroxidase [Pseudomonadales bacterium]|jgi:glutathione peroxidase|nr:glutathione peroxidase [Pseudomonadales bacterium]
MSPFRACSLALFTFCLALPALSRAAACPLLDHRLPTLGRAETVDLCDRYAGKVVLVVNTASQCSYTPQFAGLERLYARYADQGFVVLGFPSGDFGGQEYLDAARTEQVCRVNYGVSFPMFDRLHAAEGEAHPLFRGLGEAAGEYPGWNFHKYLIGRDGRLVASFRSGVAPESGALTGAIETALGDTLARAAAGT